MWYFCKYKRCLGEPKNMDYKVFDDVLLTFVLAKFIQYYIMEETEFSLILVFLFFYNE